MLPHKAWTPNAEHTRYLINSAPIFFLIFNLIYTRILSKTNIGWDVWCVCERAWSRRKHNQNKTDEDDEGTPGFLESLTSRTEY